MDLMNKIVETIYYIIEIFKFFEKNCLFQKKIYV